MTQVCVVIADGCIDIIQEDGPDLKAHVKELRDMGCTVKVKRFATWQDAETYEEKVTYG